MANFYHVFIQPKNDVTNDQVEKKMGLSLDWFRCTPSVWILFSSSRIDKWQRRLLPLVEPDGSLFICKLDISIRKGLMSPEFWKWIRKNEKKIIQTRSDTLLERLGKQTDSPLRELSDSPLDKLVKQTDSPLRKLLIDKVKNDT